MSLVPHFMKPISHFLRPESHILGGWPLSALANCDTPELYDVTLYSIVQFGLQVLPSIPRYCHRHSLHSLPNALFYPPPTHPPPAPIIIISPRYDWYETMPEAHPDDMKDGQRVGQKGN